MTTPTDRNRLEDAASPYLRQHADNPVNWQPWDEQARSTAREHDVPIFLSVGYSACHWCHVMEEESFDDEAVAEQLNEQFVPIKVDREERPDIDRIYQTVCQQVSGRGGWPLSVWLTPDGEPFYVGTYFPRQPRQGMPSFLDVLDSIQDSWTNQREDVVERAAQWSAMVRKELESVPGGDGSAGTNGSSAAEQPAVRDSESDTDQDSLLVDVATALHRSADRQHGGFGNSGPKFPQPPRIDVLFQAFDRTGRDGFESVLRTTLDEMANNGLYDQLGGGFHRYSTDREWVVPHFEKMLYDNAELPRIYTEADRLLETDRYGTVVEETMAFLDEELSHPDGGLFSTLNAQSPVPPERPSEGSHDDVSDESDEPSSEEQPETEEEGAFYVWTPAEVHEAIDDTDLADLFCDRFGVTERGNFEGATVLTIDKSIAELAAAREEPESVIRNRLADARQQAFAYRSERPRPSLDDKVIGAWNGLLIGAAADASLAYESIEPDRAVDALAFVREHLWDGDRLARRYKDGAIGGEGYLEDYAFLGRGAVRTYEATGTLSHLQFARSMARTIEAAFWEEADGTLYFTPADGERLIARPQEPADQSTPSSLGVATELLLLVDPFVPHDRYREIAASVVDTYRSAVESSPLRYPTLALCADRLDHGATEITLAVDGDGGTAGPDHGVDVPAEWRETIGSDYVPHRTMAPRPGTEAGLEEWLDELGVEEAPPIWQGREHRDGGDATAYVCRNKTCSPPLSDPSELPDWIERLAE